VGWKPSKRISDLLLADINERLPGLMARHLKPLRLQ
jgi:hypothetical protein